MNVNRASEDTRSRIIAVALGLVLAGGEDAVSTRAVCAGASVQAPTIYRLFGDKDGLLDVVAHEGFRIYLRNGGRHTTLPDAVEEIRRGWDAHIAFGLGYPHLYLLGYGRVTPGKSTSAAATGVAIVSELVRRVARDGMLQVPESRAVQMLTAGAIGTTVQLLSLPEEHRDPHISTHMRESVLTEIMTDNHHATPLNLTRAAIQLRSSLHDLTALSPHESDLLGDWLARITDGAEPGPSSREPLG